MVLVWSIIFLHSGEHRPLSTTSLLLYLKLDMFTLECINYTFKECDMCTLIEVFSVAFHALCVDSSCFQVLACAY